MVRGRVLLVDADPDILTTVTGGLRAAGYDVLTAADVATATDRAARQAPDVVVLDIALPGSDGHAVTELLRANPSTAAIAVVYLSARAEEADYERARELGVAKYITKPFELAVLVAAIDGLIDRQAEVG
jgi:DNA-binding response OmpR family regulator